MNHQTHRVIFNKSRCCMMAVSEVASSAGKTKSSKSRQSRATRCKPRVLPILSLSKPNLVDFYLLKRAVAQSIRARAATNYVAFDCLTLAADNGITLQAAKNESSQTSTNSNSSSSVSVSYSATTGWGGGASASRGSGKSDGQDTTFTNTNVSAGNTATIKSGGDTNVIGAVVAANQIKADIGGNLNIESLQDTSTYSSSQKSMSASVSVGEKNSFGASVGAAKSNINSNFQSVGQQSGLKAGDGGFAIDVKGNTDLKGSVIASTQAALENARNSFKTGGALSITDIQNTASFSGSGYSLGASFSTSDVKNKQGNTVSKTTPGGSAGFGSAGGSASSVSSAGISGIAGNTAVRTGDAETGIQRIFDAEKVQREINAQVAITAAFGSQASKAIGDYAQTQTDIRDRKLAEANGATGDRRTQLLQEAQAIDDNWGSTGTLKLIAHTVVGGLTGGVGGAAGAAAGTLAAPAAAQALAEAGITGGLATTLTALASTAAGAIAGGGVAGATTAFNEVVNNYLNHNRPSMLRLSEREKYDAAAAGCASKDAAACKMRDELVALSVQRDLTLAQACGGQTADYCNDEKSKAIAMGNNVFTTPGGFTYANSPTPTSLNTSTIGPVTNPRTGTFQDAVARSTAEALLLEVGNQALGALIIATVKGVGVTSGTVKNYFAANGVTVADDTAMRIANNFGREGDRFTEVAEQMMMAKQANWVTPQGRIIYPPGNGAVPGTEFQTVLPVGTKLDRYGAIGEKTDFLAPVGTPLAQRALPAGSESRQLVQLEVLRPLPMQQSNVMPWFGQEGMGVQFQSTASGLVLPNGAPATIENLIKAKYLKVISP